MSDWREEAIKAGVEALYTGRAAQGYKTPLKTLVTCVVDAVEPIIRADEQEASPMSDDAIEAVEAALIGYGYAGDEIVERRTTPADWDALTVAQIAVETAEPIIRADEQAKTLEFCCNDTRPQIEADVRERLRVQVEKIQDKVEKMQDRAGLDFDGPWEALQEVLILLEETDD